MHDRIRREFEQILGSKEVGDSILEVGATPDDSTLLCLDALRPCQRRVGLNLDGPYDFDDIEIIKGNSNEIAFPDESFSCVLSNATLEHDKFFWKSISEMKRVLKPGGLMVIGVPGYDFMMTDRLRYYLGRLPGLGGLSRRLMPQRFLATQTLCLHFHFDYYRFSRQAMGEVLLEGLEEIETWSVMNPPRILGVGRKPN